MATIAQAQPAKRHPFAVNLLERLLAAGSLMLLGFVIAAIVRGYPLWDRTPPIIWLHLATVVIALALTPVMLLRLRGDRRHRRIGWAWAIAMFTTALISFGIRLNQKGGLSWIHVLSVVVVLSVPWLVWNARRHRVEKHRRTAQTLVLTALMTAGFFTFPFSRLLGRWLFG